MHSSQDLPHVDDRGPSDERMAGRPSIGRRIFRAISRFCIAVLIGVGATLAWQSHGEEAKEMVRTWAPSLEGMLHVIPTRSSARASLPDLFQQQELIARDLAIVRRSLEHLAAKQEQMALHMQSSFSVPSWAVPILPRSPQHPAKESALRPPPASPAPPPVRQPLALH